MNLHTHHRPSDSTEQFILNCYPGAVPADVERCSVGLHPWHVDDTWQQQLEHLRQDLLLPNVVAIGECGLDMVKGPELSLQQAAFEAQILLAESHHLPLIIHCVRAFDQLLQLHKKYNPQQLWIVHGFRGKPQLAQQLLARGIRLSFGVRFNPATLELARQSGIPFYRETDDEMGVNLIDIISPTSSGASL